MRPLLVAICAGLFVLVTAILAGGCARTTRIVPVVIGPVVGSPSAEAFDRLLESARTQGYEPDDADVSLGVFHVAARWSRDGAHRFDVQCFASGHVQIVAVGPRVRRDGAEYVMSPALRDELLAFTHALAAGAGVSREDR